MMGRTLMVQGTSSSAGKSLLAAALCRIFARRGWKVAPFKAQNMSNNAAVCPDGSEIGRAQALQALAAGTTPRAEMNPVLLKPEGNAHSQVIVEGRLWKRLAARDYYDAKKDLWPIVTRSLDSLRADHDLVVIEGAGSPVELNLSENDIVNMAVAQYARAPVLLVGDIDRGGIFAQLLGTLWLLTPSQRELVQGLLVNKFRGDPGLFAPGVRLLEEKGDVPVWGVIPWIDRLLLPEEDAVCLERRDFWGNVDPSSGSDTESKPRGDKPAVSDPSELDIALIHFPHIANFDDFDPLVAEAGVHLRRVRAVHELGRPRVVILPGTKSTMDDLVWLKATGLGEAIRNLAAEGVHIVGICGGYQMLGRRLRDPDQVESSAGELPGLGLLPLETQFCSGKLTRQVEATILDDRHCPGCRGMTLRGYEIHVGRTFSSQGCLRRSRTDSEEASRELDGAVSGDGTVWGCYLHGLFENDHFRRAWIDHLRSRIPFQEGAAPARPWSGTTELNGRVSDHRAVSAVGGPWSEQIERSLDRLADVVEASLQPGWERRVLEGTTKDYRSTMA